MQDNFKFGDDKEIVGLIFFLVVLVTADTLIDCGSG